MKDKEISIGKILINRDSTDAYVSGPISLDEHIANDSIAQAMNPDFMNELEPLGDGFGLAEVNDLNEEMAFSMWRGRSDIEIRAYRGPDETIGMHIMKLIPRYNGYSTFKENHGAFKERREKLIAATTAILTAPAERSIAERQPKTQRSQKIQFPAKNKLAKSPVKKLTPTTPAAGTKIYRKVRRPPLPK